MHRSALALLALAALSACARPRTTPSPVGERAALRAAIDSMADHPEFRNAHWGILIVDPERGDTLYSRNAGKLFMPASNQKILTGAVALAQLGPDYRYRTSIDLEQGALVDSTYHGALRVSGSGDPSISDAMRGDAAGFLRSLADSLRARGIARIHGEIVSVRDAFSDAPLGLGWAWDDLDYAYSAGADELMLNEGFGDVIVAAGAAVGDSARITLRAPGSFAIRNEVKTVAARVPNGPSVTRVQWEGSAAARAPWPRNVLVLRGTIGAGETDTISAAFRDQNGAFLDALTAALRERGMELTESRIEAHAPARIAPIVITSPTMRDILKRMEKPSQNQIAEALYKTLGLEKTGVGTADSGRRVVERQLVAWGAQPDGFAVRDGSGLSRHDYVTPETIVKVLDAMRKHEHFRTFYDALPIAGVDGTIRSRMRGTPAENNVHAKTGFVDKARSLSGYVTTADGRMLLFSFLANNWTTPTRSVERVQDAIAARLAGMRLGQ